MPLSLFFWLNTWFRSFRPGAGRPCTKQKDGLFFFYLLLPSLSLCSHWFHSFTPNIRRIKSWGINIVSLTYIACGARRSVASAVFRVGIQNSAAAEDGEGTNRPIWRNCFQMSFWSSCEQCDLLNACRPRVGDDQRGRCSCAARLNVGVAAQANSPPEKHESDPTGNRHKHTYYT